jgi:hypothetical protein
MKLPTPQAAAALGWSPDFLRNRCKEGVFVEGEHWFYRNGAKNAPRIFDVDLCAAALADLGYQVRAK